MNLRLLTLLALGLALAAPPAEATYAGGNGKLAFAEAPYPGEFGHSIATVNADGTGYQTLTTGTEPAWSPDGQRIAFVTPQRAVAVMNADGTGRRNLTDRQEAEDPTWSPDGQQLAVVFDPCACIALTRLDGSESRRVYQEGTNVAGEACTLEDLEWAPTGTTIAFSGRPCLGNGNSGDPEIFTIQADGTGLTKLTDEEVPAVDPEWSPDGEHIIYGISQGGAENVISIRPDGTERTLVTQGRDATWAPDASEIAYVVRVNAGTNWRIEAKRTDHDSSRQILTTSLVDLDLDWQRVPPGFTGYPRPRAASPTRFALVPTYYPCLEPNREHGPSLAFPSCNPPVPGSNYLTVGTADANGNPPRFVGELRYDAVPGNPGTPADEADVQLTATLADIRCRVAGPSCVAGALSDFSGKLRLRYVVRITDKLNALGHSITVQDSFMQTDIPCSVTPASPAGSDCNTATTLDAIVPGTVPEGKRSNWRLDQIVIYDGGPNGDHSAGAPTQFAVPGIWVP